MSILLHFDPVLLGDHFDRHRTDFGATTEYQYEAEASAFLTRALPQPAVTCNFCPECSCHAYGPRQAIHECMVSGERIRYDTVTGTYATLGVNGLIRTFMKPTPFLTRGKRVIEYFHDWCRP